MQKLMIIDGNSLLYRGFYAMPLLTTAEGKFTNAVYSFVSILVKAIDAIKPDYLVVAFDYGKKTFRNEIFADYKAGRRETPIELQSQFPLMKEVLNTMGICYIEKQGIEADDIIATVSKRYNNLQKIILSGDKDSFQLIDENTSIYFTRKGMSDVKIVDVQALKEEYGITPSQVVDVKALMGDKSDNIPGVSGVGEKTAYKLICEFGSLDAVYNSIDALTGSVKNKLLADKESAYMSYELARNVEDKELECDIEKCKLSFPFNEEVKKIFKKLEFKSLYNKKSLFVESEQEFVEFSGEQIPDETALDALVEVLKKSSEFSIFFNEQQFQIACEEKLYSLDIDYSFLSSGLKFNKIVERLKPIFEDEKITKIIYDYKKWLYDLADFKVEYKNVFDVAIAKYLLESTIKDYGLEDYRQDFKTQSSAVAIMRAKQAFLPRMEKFNLVNLFNEVEIPLCEVLYNMEVNGIKIDVEHLKIYDAKFTEEMKECENKIFELVGHEFNLKSPKQVAEVLYDELNLNKNSKKKSTNVDSLNNLIDKHEVVPLIIRHRKLIKLKNTYIDNYFKFEQEGFIHTEFNQMSTDTGRLSSTNPNLQNIPVRDDEGKFIREAFISRFADGVMVSFDYDQIELKLMAHMSGDEIMVDAFNSGKDIHRATAAKIYGIEESAVTAEQRQSAKAVNFGIIYGQGAYGLSVQLGCSIKEASAFIDSYFSTFFGVKNYVAESIKKITENDCTAVTLFGRRRYIPELMVDNYNLKLFGERVAINMPLQGSASDIIKIAMVKINKMLKEQNLQSKLVLQIHDELVFDAIPSELPLLEVKVKEIMESVIELKVPLTVSVSVGKNLLK